MAGQAAGVYVGDGMSKKDEALKLALEALENAEYGDYDKKELNEAITAIREALAEQPAPATELREQEPVAWMYDWICDGKLLEGWIAHKESEIPRSLASNIRPLYTSPPAQQEPVAWMDGYRNIYSLEEKAAGCPEATIALVPMANHKKTSGSPIKELNCICGAVWEGDELVHLPRPPAQRTWVGLTDGEKRQMFEREDYQGWLDYINAIEAKLKEKNNG